MEKCFVVMLRMEILQIVENVRVVDTDNIIYQYNNKQ